MLTITLSEPLNDEADIAVRHVQEILTTVSLFLNATHLFYWCLFYILCFYLSLKGGRKLLVLRWADN